MGCRPSRERLDTDRAGAQRGGDLLYGFRALRRRWQPSRHKSDAVSGHVGKRLLNVGWFFFYGVPR